jgi:hypothetical protein
MNLRRFTLPADKANHVVWGFAVALAAAWLAAKAGYPLNAGPIGAMAALVVGAIKELADYLANQEAAAAGQPAPHTVDPVDAMATAAGGVALWAGYIVVGA